jgi:GTPase SAR1 family protein
MSASSYIMVSPTEAASAGSAGAGATTASPPALPAALPDTRVAREIERRHELVALVDGRLTLNFANYEAFRDRGDVDAPTLVVSFLGDTSVGKSTVIRELIGDLYGEDRPYVQRSAEQLSSTTSNVNMFTSARMVAGYAVHLLDFEGESGSATPLMAASGGGAGAAAGKPPGHTARVAGAAAGSGSSGSPEASPQVYLGERAVSAPAGGITPTPAVPGSVRGSGHEETFRKHYAQLMTDALPVSARSRSLTAVLHGSNGHHEGAGASPGGMGSAASILSRAQEVRECFPRLAYCISDIVVLVGTDTLFSSRYMERALAFAKQANSNIQDVELPVLIVINNKVGVDTCQPDIKVTSQ